MTISHLFPSDDTIDILQPFMLTHDRKYILSLFVNIDPTIEITDVSTITSIEEPTEGTTAETVVPVPVPIEQQNEVENSLEEKIKKYAKTPKNVQDSLFACIFMAHHGYNEYLRVCKHFGKFDSAEKENIITYLCKETPAIFKTHTNYNLTKTLHNKILHDLSTQATMPIHCVIALVLYYKCSIYIVDLSKNIYLPFVYHEECPTYIVYKNKSSSPKRKHSDVSYSIDINQDVLKLNELKANMYELIHYDKPVKGISTYKITELQAIAQKLHIVYDEKIKKTELYEKIGLQCTWHS
jgi:hypothetical protein